ncbi:hypothetical protein GCM10011611_26940 [Aliidongia dinghuensis]|uniref:TadE-like domain-containing protein n=1 Tax=Aliidongia dinghuensis TaxID=1867774 RepID=A0A8J2YTT7_9PROT|nr:TadE/TadG family type IV pilus assembly protein [Aliidongia dinghuensis]GGF19604.1 hypothetical protein GCM10011611_26940 [Aliidongia dinghuensis]
MIAHRHRICGEAAGTAAVEFALIAPLLLLVVGILCDFGFAFRAKAELAESVAAGMQYATLASTNVSTTQVTTIVAQKLSLPSGNVTVSGPSCYCVTGTPAATTPIACSSICSDGSSPGLYLNIAATYTYTTQLPALSHLVNPTFQETAFVRLR